MVAPGISECLGVTDTKTGITDTNRDGISVVVEKWGQEMGLLFETLGIVLQDTLTGRFRKHVDLAYAQGVIIAHFTDTFL